MTSRNTYFINFDHFKELTTRNKLNLQFFQLTLLIRLISHLVIPRNSLNERKIEKTLIDLISRERELNDLNTN